MEGLRINRDSDRTEIRLSGRLTVSDTPVVHRELDAVLDGARFIAVDGSELTALDAAMFQLLTLFFSVARARRVEIHWLETSAALREGAELLGLSAALGFKEVANATRH